VKETRLTTMYHDDESNKRKLQDGLEMKEARRTYAY
jgi:hypothetical protein